MLKLISSVCISLSLLLYHIVSLPKKFKENQNPNQTAHILLPRKEQFHCSFSSSYCFHCSFSKSISPNYGLQHCKLVFSRGGSAKTVPRSEHWLVECVILVLLQRLQVVAAVQGKVPQERLVSLFFPLLNASVQGSLVCCRSLLFELTVCVCVGGA